MPLFTLKEPTPEGRLQAQATLFRQDELYQRILEELEDPLVVLNVEREIVFANDRFIAFSGEWSRRKLLGRKLGEALGCWRSTCEASGCGTTRYCDECGAAQAIHTALGQERGIHEFRLLNETNHAAAELRVIARAIEVADQQFLLVILRDITDEKRRAALERIFLHDISNTLSSLTLATQLLKIDGLEEHHALFDGVVRRLVDEVRAQRTLRQAEQGELTPTLQEIDLTRTLIEAVEMNHSRAEKADQRLVVDAPEARLSLSSDSTLLARVIDNMVKNAIEASPQGSTITIGATHDKGNIEIWVHNPVFMPHETSSQVFLRSFSTKGSGRGLGTYSMKLLGERYLGGKVGFTTSRDEGTRFFIRFEPSPLH